MPMDVVPKPLYPVVPFAPGVPALLRSGALPTSLLTFGAVTLIDALGDSFDSGVPRWGVFNSFGVPVALADNVMSMDYKNSSRVSDFPVENGAFASYNKVVNPFVAKVRMSKGGSVVERAAFKAMLDIAETSLELFTIVMPDAIYLDATIESVDWRHEASNGAGMVIAELQLRQIRQVDVLVTTTPKAPGAAASVENGQVQTLPASSGAAAGVALNPLK